VRLVKTPGAAGKIKNMKTEIKVALIPAIALIIATLIGQCYSTKNEQKEYKLPVKNAGQSISDQQNQADKVENNHIGGDYVAGDKYTETSGNSSFKKRKNSQQSELSSMKHEVSELSKTPTQTIFNITSNDQTGGITANQVTIGSMPRSMSTQSINQLLIGLSTVAKEEISIRALFSDAESQQFSISLKTLFEKAGWNIKEHMFYIPKQSMKNLTLGVPNSKKDTQTAYILYNWLKINGYNVIAEIVPDEKGYIIFVGLNNGTE